MTSPCSPGKPGSSLRRGDESHGGMSGRRAVLGAGAAALLLLPSGGAARAAEPACPLGHHDGHITEMIQMVYFDWNDAKISPQAVWSLDNVVTISKQIPQCPIRITGHADTSGPAAYNLALSRHRARAIVAWLRRRGVRAEIRASWWGETRPLVDTADNVRELQNRFAQISMDWE